MSNVRESYDNPAYRTAVADQTVVDNHHGIHPGDTVTITDATGRWLVRGFYRDGEQRAELDQIDGYATCTAAVTRLVKVP